MLTKTNTRKALLILILTLVFFCVPKTYLGDSYPICLFRVIFHVRCLGCGTTRAFWSVLHLKFRDAYAYNHLVLITFPLCVGCIISWILKKSKNKTAA